MRTFDQEPLGLSVEHRETLEALLAHSTRSAAAKALGISRPALYRRLAVPDLKEAYEAIRRQAIADATDYLQGVAASAVAVLHEMANDPGVPAHVRVTAASKILDMALKAHELQDVLQRLAALEAELV